DDRRRQSEGRIQHRYAAFRPACRTAAWTPPRTHKIQQTRPRAGRRGRGPRNRDPPTATGRGAQPRAYSLTPPRPQQPFRDPAALSAAVDALPTVQRQVARIRLDGMRPVDIARITGRSRRAVASA